MKTQVMRIILAASGFYAAAQGLEATCTDPAISSIVTVVSTLPAAQSYCSASFPPSTVTTTATSTSTTTIVTVSTATASTTTTVTSTTTTFTATTTVTSAAQAKREAVPVSKPDAEAEVEAESKKSCKTDSPCSNGVFKGTQCTVRCDYDRLGGDYKSFGGSFKDCVKACDKDVRCITAQYHEDISTCYLKNSANPLKWAEGVDTIDCRVSESSTTKSTSKKTTSTSRKQTTTTSTMKTTSSSSTTTTTTTTTTGPPSIQTLPSSIAASICSCIEMTPTLTTTSYTTVSSTSTSETTITSTQTVTVTSTQSATKTVTRTPYTPPPRFNSCNTRDDCPTDSSDPYGRTCSCVNDPDGTSFCYSPYSGGTGVTCNQDSDCPNYAKCAFPPGDYLGSCEMVAAGGCAS